MNNPFNLNESEKNRIRGLHKNYSIIKEEPSGGDVGNIEGVPTSLLHPMTQKWIGGGKNVFDMIKMMTDCHCVGGECKTDHPTTVVKPHLAGSYDGGDIVLDSNIEGQGAKFCFMPSGGKQLCFKPCELGRDSSSWKKTMPHGAFDVVKDEMVAVVTRLLEGSGIWNGHTDSDDDATIRKYNKGGEMFGWRANGTDINTKFILKKV
jgi:hypothetical protein